MPTPKRWKAGGTLIDPVRTNVNLVGATHSDDLATDTTTITFQVGDITSVVAGTGLDGGGTSGAVTLDIDSTVCTLTGEQTLTSKTLTSPIIGTGLTASGSAANTFAGSTGTFVTSTGANTLSGDTTLAAGKDLLCAAGDSAFDFSLGTGVFKTPTGVNTFGGKQAAGATTNNIADPGNAGAIPVTTSGTCNMTSAGAETRTIADPTFEGQWIALTQDVYAGDVVVATATAVNVTGNNRLTLGAAGESIGLIGVRIAGALSWRISFNDGVGLTTV